MTDTNIIPVGNGLVVANQDNSIRLHNTELANVGCGSCVMEANGQCPHPTHAKKLVICDDMTEFLFSLVEKGDTASALWEKYHIYIARLEVSKDYQDYKRLQRKINRLELKMSAMSKRSKHSDTQTEDSEILAKQLDELHMDKNAAKLWWVKLNQHVVLSLQKVVDREVKDKGSGRMPGILSAKTINFNLGSESKEKSIESHTSNSKHNTPVKDAIS